jgi:hypothetical protein
MKAARIDEGVELPHVLLDRRQWRQAVIRARSVSTSRLQYR